MSSRIGTSSAARLKKLAEASSLLLAAAGLFVLLAWVYHSAAWQTIVPTWAAMKATPALVFIMAGGVLWIVVTVLLWFSARALERAQQKIAHRERLYAVLSHCNQSIVHLAERGPLFARVCEIAVDLGKFRMA
jgi:high-affinity Fe2+/Pb2+ permease